MGISPIAKCDDGLSYGDYPSVDSGQAPTVDVVAKNLDWQNLMRLDADESETQYRHVLESLGKRRRNVWIRQRVAA